MSKTHNTGISVSELLGITFLVLKLTGVIDWSWWWVLLPFYVGVGFTLLLLAVCLVVFLLTKVEKTRKRKTEHT